MGLPRKKIKLVSILPVAELIDMLAKASLQCYYTLLLVSGIRLSFYGGGKVSYVITDTHASSHGSMHERKERTLYRSIEEYFNHTMYVFGARRYKLFTQTVFYIIHVCKCTKEGSAFRNYMQFFHKAFAMYQSCHCPPHAHMAHFCSLTEICFSSKMYIFFLEKGADHLFGTY